LIKFPGARGKRENQKFGAREARAGRGALPIGEVLRIFLFFIF